MVVENVGSRKRTRQILECGGPPFGLEQLLFVVDRQWYPKCSRKFCKHFSHIKTVGSELHAFSLSLSVDILLGLSS